MSASHSSAAPSTLTRWCRFNLVGGIGIAVQFALLFMLKFLFGIPYLAATAIAVELTVVHNFLWHERFTWADRCSPELTTRRRLRDSFSRLLRFNFTNGAVSLIGNLALMRLMVGEAHLNYLASNAIAITLCSIANFMVSDEWVFADQAR